MGWPDERCGRGYRSGLPGGEPGVVRVFVQIPSSDDIENHGGVSKVRFARYVDSRWTIERRVWPLGLLGKLSDLGP